MPCLPRNAVAKLNVHGSSLENEVVEPEKDPLLFFLSPHNSLVLQHAC
jgi:hypothetical protein